MTNPVTVRNVPMYEVTDAATGNIIMLAPISTIRSVYRLHDSAVRRVENEYDHCELFNVASRVTGTACNNIVTRRVNVEVK